MDEAIDGAATGEKDSVKRFVHHGQEYITLLMRYIENEEDWLFPRPTACWMRQSNRSSANACNATTVRIGAAAPRRSMWRSPTDWRITSVFPGAQLIGD